MSQKVGEAALGVQDCSRVSGPQDYLGEPLEVCAGVRLHREDQQQTRVCPQVAARWAAKTVPTLEEDLSFSKSLKVAPGEMEAKSESMSECQ